MKRKYIAVLMAVMAVSITACGQTAITTDNSEEIAELKEEIEALKEETAELKAKLEATDTSSPKQTDEESSELDNFIVETSGVCGADLTWEYGNGILRIHGTGEMTDYNKYFENDKNNYTSPWNDIKTSIGHVIIDDGVTTIGEMAFAGCSSLSKIVIPNSIEQIRDFSFHLCRNCIVNVPDNIIYAYPQIAAETKGAIWRGITYTDRSEFDHALQAIGAGPVTDIPAADTPAGDTPADYGN